ncbi:Serine carboxypeptidase-like 49, partial [Mucuna pruriens]
MGHSLVSRLIFLSNLLLILLLPSTCASDDVVLYAKKLVRGLNLFPDDDVNVVPATNSSLQPHNIVEKRIRFPSLVGLNSGVSVEDLGHYAGYYSIHHSHAARMFYFFFESRNSKEDPVVIWLTGGPGCSSELALFYENGPFKIADNLSLVWNEYGWDKASNLIYVDQPTGTGFSYSTDLRDIRHNEEGESYAGHYIPAFATRIHRGNQAKEGIHINLKGFAIGNGLTNPAIQYKAYADYALEMGIIKKATRNRLNKVLVPACELAIKLCGNTT